MRNKKGFTLIELLAVIIILGIILAIAVPRVLSVISSSKQSGLKNSSVAVYKSLENQISMHALGIAGSTALTASVVAFDQTCPTTAWNATADATCAYTYDGSTMGSLQVRLTAVSGGKFAGSTVETYIGN